MAAAFSIQCRDGKRYKIVFSKDQQVQMIRLRAGVCQLEDVIYAGWKSARDQASPAPRIPTPIPIRVGTGAPISIGSCSIRSTTTPARPRR